MAKTLIEKILSDHLVTGEIIKGQEIGIKIDQTLTQDATGTMAYLQFEAIGVPKIKTELSVSYIDHNTLQTGFENADDHLFLQSIAVKYNIYFSRPGNGICHQIHLERFGIPGKTLLGSDSHTSTGGGIGMLAIGAGGLDVAVAMAGGLFYLTVPKVVNIELKGRLKPYVSAKDIILKILGILNVKGGIGKVIEYTGKGLKTLSVPERSTIANMGAELGATTSIFPSDKTTKAFLEAQGRGSDYKELKADKEAIYDKHIIMNLDTIEPLAAAPHSPDNIQTIRELNHLKVDQVAIGSCTNSSFTDLTKVAHILEGKTIHPNVSLVISPGSKQVFEMLIENGTLKKLISSGARILESACGPCIGMGQSPNSGAISLRTFNRNFCGRSGTKDASIYLVSPETAAASALTGYITDPTTINDNYTVKTPTHFLINDNMILKPTNNPRATKIIRGPNIKPLPTNRPLANNLVGNVLLKVKDNITTDHIMPAGAKVLPLRSNIPEAIENTVKIKDRCNVNIKFNESHLPDYKVPDGETLESYLKKLCLEGVIKKYGAMTKEIKERLYYELNVINKMNYPGYFLIVWDMITFAKKKGIYVGPGRGSAAGSIVAYVLDITTINPLKYDLIFERFLNPERISLPDIDTDFCYVRREEVIGYLIKKYGEDHVAQIVTFGTMAARAVIRDVGRVMDIPLRDVDKVAKMVPNELKITLEKAMKTSLELQSFCKERSDIKELIKIAKRLEGMPRHTSTHAAAVVITPKPLKEYLPIKMEGEGYLTTQFPMNTVEDIGLLKMDLLGLRTLTAIGETVEKIKKNRGIAIDIEKIPLDDKKTFQLLATGNTSGLFQLESKGMQAIIKQLKPDTFEEIIALVALYRPGPIGSGMIDDFIKRKHKQIEIEYLHPMLQSILKDTYGVILYQEQVMRIASQLGGFTLAEADNLRKAMGKKIPEILEKSRQGFIEGCRKSKIDEKTAEKIFRLMEYFAGYGFNKSHSAAYAILAYETAYLKAHYPVEFMASLLSSVIVSSTKVTQYILECKKMGICVLPPDVNESKEGFIVKKNTIRFGLGAIKNVGVSAIESILEARQEGPFLGIDDFCRRVDLRTVGKKIMEHLSLSGAFSSFNIPRKALIVIIEDAVDLGHRFQKEKYSNQISLFDIDSTLEEEKPTRVTTQEEFPLQELLQKEKEVLGFYISAHPLEEYPELIDNFNFYRLSDIEENDDKRKVIIRGVLSNIKEKKTRNNELMVTFVLEDETDSIECLIFPSFYTEIKNLIKEGAVVSTGGRLQITERENKYIIEKVVKPENYLAIKNYGTYTKKMSVRKNKSVLKEAVTISVKDKSVTGLDALKRYLIFNKGNMPVILRINNKVIPLGHHYAIKNEERVIEALSQFGEIIVR